MNLPEVLSDLRQLLDDKRYEAFDIMSNDTLTKIKEEVKLHSQQNFLMRLLNYTRVDFLMTTANIIVEMQRKRNMNELP